MSSEGPFLPNQSNQPPSMALYPITQPDFTHVISIFVYVCLPLDWRHHGDRDSVLVAFCCIPSAQHSALHMEVFSE